MEEEKGKKGGIDIDWNNVLDSRDDHCDPLERVAVPESKPTTFTADEPPKQSGMGDDQQRDRLYEDMPDSELDDSIRRNKLTQQKMAHRLPDKGEKLQIALKRMVDEWERRRKLRREGTGTGKWEKPTQAVISRNIGASIGSSEEASFVSLFKRKLEENSDSRTASEYHGESSLHPCNRQNMKNNGELLQKGGHKGRSSSRFLRRQCPNNFYHKRDKCSLSNGDHKGMDSSPYPLRHCGENMSSCATRNDASQVNDLRPRKAQNVVVVDDEESQSMDTTEEAEELPECMKETKIYYPSRRDPESVEICYADIKCLDPGCYLTSTIMNFYIRNKHPQRTGEYSTAISLIHFFTRSSKRLSHIRGTTRINFLVSLEGGGRVLIYSRRHIYLFRFMKSYFQLVITGGFDTDVLCSYLKEEWNYLDQEVAVSDIPISDSIWNQLPNKIEEKKLAVPQQRNEYDCGLFVLFFMERFIEEAPQRLQRKNLAMFGKRWFKPEEASSLRMKIRKLLIQEFRDAHQVNCSKESSPQSGASEE
ncbi:ubiquitin-like-specific protease 1D isoform X3 [Prunus dulcis]|uniref:ubiquitin-like-specific protease 1D isoform X3 n=1 Tax=Prunus dulcis TaxID=3755 RepID=UPI001482222E|nr:ubiquitin-like-specific protease 1D isoform X3 [Prunus dulcis]